jgi:hypothetical protein
MSTEVPGSNAPSPFIAGTEIQYAWDSTSLGMLKECPRKYYYSMVLGYRPMGESVHLRFGILYHSALEQYEHVRAKGGDHEDGLDTAVAYCLANTWDGRTDEDEGAPWESGHSKKHRESLLRTVIWNLEQYGDNDPAKTILLANGRPAVELSFRLNLDIDAPNGEPYMLSGHMDRMVDYGGMIYVMDHKTSGSTLGSYYFEGYSPDNQMSLYTYASQVIYNQPVAGVIIDAAQIAVGFSAFQRGITTRSKGLLDEWMRDTEVWLDSSVRFADKGFWPMNDKSCHNYGGCPFRQVCNKDPMVRDSFLKTNFEILRWNPLQPR